MEEITRIKVPLFVKWAGGKSQLLDQYRSFFPKKINDYYEPFVGGGAVAFYILKNRKPRSVFLSDINEELINAYNIIKENTDELIALLKTYKKKHNKEMYYNVRAEDPMLLSSMSRAGRFIYLNKTCFNGLYRVNSKGQFNVPIGSYENPTICQEKALREVAKLLENADIKADQFYNAVKTTSDGDFVYFDPPYHPLKKGKSFTTYTKEKFLEKEQEHLAKIFKRLDKKGCNVMLSNSNTKFIRNLYEAYNITLVDASRIINCNGHDRGKIKEIVVTNYSIEKQQLL